jgi:hypothetical protein
MSIPELMGAINHDEDWLRRALQAALELEFFTIPPYLTAMWSLKDEGHYAARTIRAVVYEEMQHMALACNMLAAIGGTPKLTTTESLPTYPNPMPGGVKPDLEVGLEGLNDRVLKDFLAIEEPENILIFGLEAVAGIPDIFDRIGQFYDAIKEAFGRIKPKLTVDKQIAGPLAPLVVATLKDVERAIELIKVQGEGTNVDPQNPQGDLAHFYRFQELQENRRLIPDPHKPGGHVWSKETLPPCEIYPVARVPRGGYKSGEVTPDVAALLDDFDNTYSRMLDELQAAWEGGGQASLWRAVEQMFSLRTPARKLMAITIPDTNKTYGPHFRYISSGK